MVAGGGNGGDGGDVGVEGAGSPSAQSQLAAPVVSRLALAGFVST